MNTLTQMIMKLNMIDVEKLIHIKIAQVFRLRL